MKNILSILAILLLFHLKTFAQTAPADTTQEAVPLHETVISANRISQSRSAVAQQVKVLNRAQMEQINAQTTADLFINSGLAFVQKSQQGGGSPVLRGFEASRVLMVVDGVRLNNAIYRAGHLQNIITMDNASLDRAEVLFGPASTVYGTDALGGAICFFTKNPTLSNGGFKTAGSAFARYGSVNEEKTGHADISLAGRRFGSLTSFTYSDFGDLRMGAQEGSAPFFGGRKFYAQRFNGKDSLVRNSDSLVQKFTGYTQHDLLQKFVFQQNSNLCHTLNVQYSNSSDIPRYDRLTDPKGSGLNSSEWYYGPQKRLMAAYTLALNELGWFNGGLRTTVSWQDIEESRHNRNFGAANRTDRVEQVGVIGLTANGQRNWGRQSLQLGLDGQYNDVISTAQRFNVNTRDTSAQFTRYPDGGSQMSNAAVYATHQWHSANDAWSFSEGARVGFVSLSATFRDTTFFRFPFTTVDQSSPVASGSLGVVWHGAKRWRVAANASSGFRMPNVDDLAKVFETQKGSVIVPNPDIVPEKTYNFDLSVTYQITDRLRWENVGWVTAFRDAIVTDVFKFGGQDSIFYDKVKSRVLANQNKREAQIFGFSSSLEADVLKNLAAYGSFTYTKGKINLAEGGTKPLDHIPPVYGRVGVRWHTSRATAEASVLFNGKKKLEDYNLEGEDNLQYAPASGMPAWTTFNLRGSYRFGKYLMVQAGVDNLLDVQYRTFASGINGPGRNVFVTLRTQW